MRGAGAPQPPALPQSHHHRRSVVVSCVVVHGRVSWFKNGVRVRRGSAVAPRGAVRAAWTRTREEKTRRKKQAAAQVATRIGTRKSPEGESSPLRGTSPGHFQRARLGNLVSCKFATEVRESPGLHRHAQMAAVATRPPLQSRGSLLRGACEFRTRAGATKVIPVPSLGFPRGGEEEQSQSRDCLLNSEMQRVTCQRLVKCKE